MGITTPSSNIVPNADLLTTGRGFVNGLATGALVVLRRKEHVRSQGLGTSQYSASVRRDTVSPASTCYSPYHTCSTRRFGAFRCNIGARLFVSWPTRRWLTCVVLAAFTVASALAAEVDDNHKNGGAYANANQTRILVFGDSLSAAYNIPREAGWVNLLRQQLRQKVADALVVNESISGATTAAGLQVLPAHLQKYKPSLVILELGANDGLQGKPIAHITANLRRLIELSLHAGAQVILVGVQLPPNYGTGYTRPFFEQYAELSEAYGLHYVPFILEGVAGNTALMQQDGLHPVAEAQPQILANVWPAVAEALELKAAPEFVDTSEAP